MESPAIMKQRLPSGKACTSCRKRKNRCDGSRPQCSTCRSRGIPCDYPIAPADRFTVEELKALMRAKIGDGAEVDLDTDGPSPISSGHHELDPSSLSIGNTANLGHLSNAAEDRPISSSHGISPLTVATGSIPVLSRDATSLAAGISSTIRNPPSPAASSSHSSCSSEEPDGYFGDSSTFAFVSKVSTSTAAPPHDNPSRHPHHRDKRRRLSSTKRCSISSGAIPGESGLGELEGGNNARSSIYDLPPKPLADSLVDAYFARVQRLYPFVHEPSFRQEYERMWSINSTRSSLASDSQRPLWFGLLNLVFAHGCEFCDAVQGPEAVAMASRFVQNARRIVFAHIFTSGSLELVQALLLMCHYLQSTLELDECWSLVGLMIRTSISLGLHSDPSSSSETRLPSVEREMRKRIWWGCYVIDRTLSMKFGRPPSIQGADTFDIDMPLDVDDQYITQDTVIPRQPEGRPSLTTVFTQTIKLAGVVEKVLLDLYQPSRNQRAAGNKSPRQGTAHSYIIGHSVLLDGELLSWWNDVPPHLKHEPEVPDGPDFKLQRNVLLMRFLNLRLIIHRQCFLIFSKHDIVDPFQRAVAIASCQTCIAAARETIHVIHSQYRRRLLNSLWYNLHYVFTAMGVLLSLQTMDRAKFSAISETNHDDTLELGMDFLRAASATSTLAARYVAMLRRIRTGPATDANTMTTTPIPAAGHRHSVTPSQDHLNGITSSPSPFPLTTTTHDGDSTSWLPPRPAEEYQIFSDSGLVDFNDLLFGTGLPRDLLSSTDWSAFGLLD